MKLSDIEIDYNMSIGACMKTAISLYAQPDLEEALKTSDLKPHWDADDVLDLLDEFCNYHEVPWEDCPFADFGVVSLLAYVNEALRRYRKRVHLFNPFSVDIRSLPRNRFGTGELTGVCRYLAQMDKPSLAQIEEWKAEVASEYEAAKYHWFVPRINEVARGEVEITEDTFNLYFSIVRAIIGATYQWLAS